MFRGCTYIHTCRCLSVERWGMRFKLFYLFLSLPGEDMSARRLYGAVSDGFSKACLCNMHVASAAVQPRPQKAASPMSWYGPDWAQKIAERNTCTYYMVISYRLYRRVDPSYFSCQSCYPTADKVDIFPPSPRGSTRCSTQ